MTVSYVFVDQGFRSGQHLSVHTSFGDHAVSYPIGAEGCFLAVMRQGREADSLPPNTAHCGNGGVLLSRPHTSSSRGS